MTKVFQSFLLLCFTTAALAQNPTSILQKAEAKLSGADVAAEVSIRTVRTRWERTMEAKIWNQGLDKTMILVTGPAREKGTVFLRNGDDVWHYVPGIKKIVALPAAMVQSWMGTDFTNDALINAGSLAEDYNPTLLGIESVNGTKCFKIALAPKADAAVVWGQVITFISVDQFLQLRTEFYDEDDYLITTLEATEIKSFSGTNLPSKLRITPADDEGNFTEMTYKALNFNPTFAEGFFERSNMKRVE
ncbi:outer membrane lipoprotein-sorting protein [Schleiferiaceae bacterium]|jgi:outer membrane lipoprotein-sorting protein|nr:outer membrane lipoprotein-sorting protein [Schleiferiaceae bacterium]